MYEHIEKLKLEYTDKYVVVVGDGPELARFAGITGRVKTVNMNGRALVEFNAWSNTGWHDIAPEFLRVVPEPPAPAPIVKAIKGLRPPETAAAKPAVVTPDATASPAPSAPKSGSDRPSVTHEAGPEAPLRKLRRSEG